MSLFNIHTSPSIRFHQLTNVQSLKSTGICPNLIAITGYGLVTSLGTDADTVLSSLSQPVIPSSQIDSQPKDTTLIPTQKWINTEYPDYTPSEYVSPVSPEIWKAEDLLGSFDSNIRRTPRHVAMGLSAVHDAFSLSNLDLDNIDPNRMGISFGTGTSGIQDICFAWDCATSGNTRKISPYSAPNLLPNAATSRISMKYKIKGPNLTPSTACAASSHAVIDGIQNLSNNLCDVFVAGGSESCIHPVTYSVFHRAQALARYNESKHLSTISSPFDVNRHGFVLGEGSGAIIMERLDSAVKRKAPILAIITGYGMTGDGYHPTSPDPTGAGAQRAMTLAWDQTIDHFPQAKLAYVNAHATSTPIGDLTEIHAISSFLEKTKAKSSNPLPVSSFKGGLGHLLGASGIVELILTAYGLSKKKMPGNCTLQQLDPEIFEKMKNKNSPLSITKNSISFLSSQNDLFALFNSFGFGGTNVSIGLGSYSS